MRRVRRAVVVSILLATGLAITYITSSELSAAPLPSTALTQAPAWLTKAIEPASRVPVLSRIAQRVRPAQSGAQQPNGASGRGGRPNNATVQTDKADYRPGEIVHITGSNWQPLETVLLHFVEWSNDPNATIDEHPDLYAIVDPKGNFSNDQFSPDEKDVNVGFTLTATGLISGLTAQTTFTDANPSANLDQCANDPSPSPNSDGCNSDATQWVNGNLGASKSVYVEGDSIPYRTRFASLATQGSHTVIIEWDTTKSSTHAIDYLTTFNQSVLNANPCLGVSGCSTFSTFAIPADPQVTGATPPVTPIAGVFRLYGGTITAVSGYSGGALFPSGDQSRRITITFTASVANPVLAWGGHIATRTDWGSGNSAVAISGSPYHTRLIDLDGSGGNQDRSLSAAAVIFPGSITIKKDAVPNNAQDFSFTTTGGLLPATFSLDDDSDSTLSNTQSYTNILNFTTYTVAETAVANWAQSFASPPCSVTSPNGGSTSTNGATVTINLAEGENVTCTFVNTAQNSHLSITKAATESGYSAVGDVIHYTIIATNDGDTTLAAVTVTDSQVSNLSCTPANGSSLAPGATMTCTASHTITQADIDAGSFFNQACVDDGAGGAAQVCADVTTPGTSNPALSITKVATESGYSAVGDVIHYTIVAKNTGNTTLAAVTVTDPQVSNLSCTPANGSSLAPNATMSCTASHTVTQADIDAGSFFNQACVDDGAGGADKKCADVTTPGTRNPALSITKVATESSYSAVGDVIHYTIVAKNTGNTTLAAVTITDTLAALGTCTPANGSPLAPGTTMTCTASHTIVQADLAAGHYLNTACVDDGPGGAAQVCANADVPRTFVNVSGSYPTATTCQQFIGNTVQPQEDGQYSVKGGKINQANPGVIFYYSRWTPDNSSAYINQAILAPSGFTTTMAVQQVTLYRASNCSAAPGQAAGVNFMSDPNALLLTGLQPGLEYVVGVKYSVSSLAGATAPASSQNIVYQFQTRDGVNPSLIVSKDENGFTLTKK